MAGLGVAMGLCVLASGRESQPGPVTLRTCPADDTRCVVRAEAGVGSGSLLPAGASCRGRGHRDRPGQLWLSDRMAYLSQQPRARVRRRAAGRK